MTKDEILHILSIVKTKKELIKLLNIKNTYNTKLKNKIILDILRETEFTTKESISGKSIKKRYIEKIKNNYLLNPNYCKECNKILEYNKRLSIFCTKSCAQKYNNKLRIINNDTKIKISKSLKHYYDNTKQKNIANKLQYVKKCENCNLFYKPYYIDSKNNKIKYTKYCSIECKKISIKNKLLIHINDKIKREIFSGWQIRNCPSYAEKFFFTVLNNNNINYIYEYKLKKDIGGNYFLDFLIETNGYIIDLEIDGKQHKRYDRIKHDKIRDEYIKSFGILVYRIEWNQINNTNGSLKMKEKINNFLNFYNSLNGV